MEDTEATIAEGYTGFLQAEFSHSAFGGDVWRARGKIVHPTRLVRGETIGTLPNSPGEQRAIVAIANGNPPGGPAVSGLVIREDSTIALTAHGDVLAGSRFVYLNFEYMTKPSSPPPPPDPVEE